jgi:hypothetical protein
MSEGIWNRFDTVTARLLQRFVRVLFSLVVLALVELAVYIGLSSISESATFYFQTLSIFFLILYGLFTLFSLACLYTKFQNRKILPPPERADPRDDRNVKWIFRVVWRVEDVLGIKGFKVDDRYRYWSLVHYMLATTMFINATYCLSRSNFGFRTPFVNLDGWEILRYTGDLLHKTVPVSVILDHFGQHFSDLQHTFDKLDFQSFYFLSFRLSSALLFISVLAMLFLPLLSSEQPTPGRSKRRSGTRL